VKGGIRNQLTYANVMATIAVFLALAGGSFALAALSKHSVGTKQLKNKAVGSKQLKGKAVTSAKLGGLSVSNSKIAAAAVTGDKIAASAVGNGQIADGAVTRGKVADSAIPFLGTLRSGQTLRGFFQFQNWASAVGQNTAEGETFQFPLTNPPTGEVVDARLNPAASSAHCSGIGGGNSQTPNADPGFLCIYVTGSVNTAATPLFDPTVTRLGFTLSANAAAAGPTPPFQYGVNGLWAVTAP